MTPRETVGTARIVKIACVSPGDVEEERQAVRDAVALLELRAIKRGFTLDLRMWEDIPPGLHPDGAQALIDEKLDLPNCDVVIGIFWKRYGVIETPPYSRTACEILRAAEAKLKHGAALDLKVYFLDKPYKHTLDDLKEHEKVLEFKDYLRKEVGDPTAELAKNFSLQIYHHLSSVLDSITSQGSVTGNAYVSGASRVIESPTIFVRSEGYTELVGETHIILAPDDLPKDGEPVLVDVIVYANTNITSRMLSDGHSQVSLFSTTKNKVVAMGQPGARKNAVVFTGVPIERPDTLAYESLVLRNLRVNATILFATEATLNPEIQAQIEVTSEDPRMRSRTLIRQPVVLARVATPIRCSAHWATDGPDLSCKDSLAYSLLVTFHTPFQGGFKDLIGESGQVAQTADHGTVLTLNLAPLVADVELLATASEVNRDQTSAQVVEIDSSGRPLGRLDTYAARKWDGTVPMVRVGSSVGWEIVRTCDETKLSFGVVLIFPRDSTGLNYAVSVLGNLGPSFTSTAAGQATPNSEFQGPTNIPRFAPSANPLDLTLSPKFIRTYLLFPYVISAGGFDTGITIANAGRDPFGTVGRIGWCTFHYYGIVTDGSAVPRQQVSKPVVPGQVLTYVLSSGSTDWGLDGRAAGLIGYVIVECNFSYGSGFAHISPLGAGPLTPGGSNSYLPIVITADRYLGSSN